MRLGRRASATTASRSLLLLVLASCAPERARDVALLPMPLAVRSTAAAPRTTSSNVRVVTSIVRRDVTVSTGGLAASLEDVVLEQLDAVFVRRLDLYAHMRPGDALTIWLRDGELVAAEVPYRDNTILAALYEGPLAPRGFYDDDGNGMQSALRARPVDLGRITSRFGQRFDVFTGAPGFHRGVDYGVVVGTPVFAVGDGRVKSVGRSKSAGNFIKVVHHGGYESAYLHLDRVDVKKGDVVGADDVIARSGNTGRSTGPHLHYELRLAGIALDPLATMPPSTVALGPLARRQHLAFIQQLQQMEDTHD